MLFSYVVARDYGFAPNPFYGVCTLATCKPKIRGTASRGDWIVGTGSSKNGRQGRLVYVMCVTEVMTFNKYWMDERFEKKKPNLRGSKKQAYGDNVYFRKDNADKWHQLDSHHSYPRGIPNLKNIKNDTQTDRILLSTEYAYWGGSGPIIPHNFRNYDGLDICCLTQGHKSQCLKSLADDFVTWFRSIAVSGCLGSPLDW